MSDPRLRSLLRQARSVARANKRAAATQLYEEIVSEYPDSAEAWLELAALLDGDKQLSALKRALSLEPENQAAVDAWSRLNTDNPEQAPQRDTSIDDDEDPFGQARKYLEEATAPIGKSSDAGTPQEQEAIPAATTPEPHDEIAAEEGVLFCANHPNRETGLRCNRCGKPVCINCIKRMPVGYRCKECVREQEDVFFSASPVHYVIALAVAVPLAFLGPFLLSLIGGFWFLAIFISPAVGTLVGRAVFYAIGRRRGRYISYLVAAAMILGVVVVLLLGGSWLSLGIYAFLAVSAAFYQLR